VQVAGGIVGQLRLLPEPAQNPLGVPEHEPDGDGERDRDPDALMHGAAHLAHRMPMGAELDGDQRRGRGDQTHAEDEEREVEVHAQRTGGQRVRPEPAHHDDIGRGERDLRKIGEDERRREGKHSAKLACPRLVRGAAIHYRC